MTPGLQAPLAIVDLETTGTRPGRDRIIEIALIGVDGFRQTTSWSTLVNPEIALPYDIQALTGITAEELASAPRFAALAGELHERLRGRIFVAHNASFDYGFLCREFERAGLAFWADALCTVRLSRRLYRQHARHDLDSLVARHGLACPSRHRALDDAAALWQFLQLAHEEHGPEVLEVAARQVARRIALPAQIAQQEMDGIPEAPGVYLFHGDAVALYVGAAQRLRSNVLAHFSGNLRSGKATRLSREVRKIEWRRTAGELGARLRAARMVRELQPALNCRGRLARSAAAPDENCPAWPHRGALGIMEKDPAGEASEIHVVDRWRYLGSAGSEAELAELLAARHDPRFDPQQYSILARHLRTRGARTVPLRLRRAEGLAG